MLRGKALPLCRPQACVKWSIPASVLQNSPSTRSITFVPLTCPSLSNWRGVTSRCPEKLDAHITHTDRTIALHPQNILFVCLS